MRDLKGKTAFVTGGASGIGLAVGRALAEAGMRVMLADIERSRWNRPSTLSKAICPKCAALYAMCVTTLPSSAQRI